MQRMSDGVHLHVEVAGAGPDVVLVHGLASSVEICWRRTGVLDRLVGAGLRVTAYDLRAHGRSDAPRGREHYGDARLVADLREVTEAYAGSAPVVVGYSMGSAVALLALAQGLAARAAVVGAPPPAVVRWTDADQAMRDAAVAALRGHPMEEVMRQWVEGLAAQGMQPEPLADLLDSHRPVIDSWPLDAPPLTVVLGDADGMAAAPADLTALLTAADVRVAPGDHISTLLSPAFTDAVVEAAHA